MTLIEAQERLIARANGCHPGHRRRVIASASKQLRAYLKSHGVHQLTAQSQQLAHQVVRDAIDMANLENASND